MNAASTVVDVDVDDEDDDCGGDVVVVAVVVVGGGGCDRSVDAERRAGCCC